MTTHWTEMDPEENWEYEPDDNEAWVTCRICGYQYDENDEFICPNCGDWS